MVAVPEICIDKKKKASHEYSWSMLTFNLTIDIYFVTCSLNKTSKQGSCWDRPLLKTEMSQSWFSHWVIVHSATKMLDQNVYIIA